ncbi:hypothetical protein A2988_04640 [Candidatus Azambacteria bacterium RIFCSPLOWO2_01_FULL_46_25]|uniref:Glycosyl transferase family 1 domain-containing protein n=1 Tax=Candidatus Azambacteria bacterium RIFCSPLOWO2_01_FULL_46_25 TaxID=1797298 RepID=A0A1F5BVW2_9BACT|nr:MAG: hypothetical protein A2988_04640 [Candidatus Azambacteria bacterium RIFCSPLOWO2_01_FULL_46_25]
MRVAFVHDYLTQFGGAERVLLALAELFPGAPLYTLLYDPEKMAPWFAHRDVRASFLRMLPRWAQRRQRWLLPFFPLAVRTLDLSAYDVVISSSASFGKGVRVKPGAVHISYCHSPTRFLWDYRRRYLSDNRFGFLFRAGLAPLLALLKMWDRRAARRVHFWMAPSRIVAERIKTYYGAHAAVIYPPFALEKQDQSQAVRYAKDYFLVVSRLSAYKKIDVVVRTFNALQLPLIIIGDGPERERLKRMANANIAFLGFADDTALGAHYQNSTALIMPCEEDFGLTAVEAAHWGKPILAYRKGGATEWLQEGKMGEFFDEQDPDVLAAGVYKILARSYDAGFIKRKAAQFDKKKFQEAVSRFVAMAIDSRTL